MVESFRRKLDALAINLTRLSWTADATGIFSRKLFWLFLAVTIKHVQRNLSKRQFFRFSHIPIIWISLLFLLQDKFQIAREASIKYLLLQDLALNFLKTQTTISDLDALKETLNSMIKGELDSVGLAFVTRATIVFDLIEDLLPQIIRCLSKRIDDRSYVETTISIFRAYGLYSVAESLEVRMYRSLSKQFLSTDRVLSLTNETKYLSAIGHMTLVDFIVRNNIYIGQRESQTILITNPRTVVNKILEKKIFEFASSSGIRIQSTAQDGYPILPNLELLPTSQIHEWVPTGRIWSTLQSVSIFQDDKPILEMTLSEIERAENLLSSLGLKNHVGKIVGFHFRCPKGSEISTRDSDSIRYLNALTNADSSNIFLGTGARPIKKSSIKNDRIFWIRDFKLSEEEIDILEVYAYARSSYFVGNLSGGTNPPRLFGTPTLWLGFHPIVHHRPPSPQDFYLPRVVRCRSVGFLSIEQQFEFKHCRSQSESLYRLVEAGYDIQDPSDFQVVRAIKEFLTWRSNNSDSGQLSDYLKECEKVFTTHRLSPGARLAEI